jgi:hypothetical protein
MTPETWAKARPLIEAAIGRGLPTHTAEDIREAIERGEMQMWCRGESVIVTEIRQFPRLKVCAAVLAGGRLDDCLDLTPIIEKWAAEHGCDYAEVYGRRGWQRVHKDYRLGAVVLRRALK